MKKLRELGTLAIGTSLVLVACSGANSGQGPISAKTKDSVSEESVGLKALNSPALNYSNALGWAQSATGGAGGASYVVENLNDAGPGSLREGLENPAALQITFKEGLGGTIPLTNPIRLQSNKTIDGRNRSITVSPANPAAPTTAFVIEKQNNIIIFNLNFDGGAENWDKDGEGSDGITIHNSNRIWIHKCSFSRWLDGAIDARTDGVSPLPSDITITSNKFEKIYQALNLTADKVTFAWNHCSQIRKRCIKIIGGKGHSYNNVIEGWNAPEIQNAKDGGQLLSQANIFSPSSTKEINKLEGGKIEMADNLYQDGASAASNDSVSNACKSNSTGAMTLCGKDKACWNALEKKIIGDAGRTSGAVSGTAGSAPVSTQSTSTSGAPTTSQSATQTTTTSSTPTTSPTATTTCAHFPRTPVNPENNCGDPCQRQLKDAARSIGILSFPNNLSDRDVARGFYRTIRDRGAAMGCDPLRGTTYN